MKKKLKFLLILTTILTSRTSLTYAAAAGDGGDKDCSSGPSRALTAKQVRREERKRAAEAKAAEEAEAYRRATELKAAEEAKVRKRAAEATKIWAIELLKNANTYAHGYAVKKLEAMDEKPLSTLLCIIAEESREDAKGMMGYIDYGRPIRWAQEMVSLYPSNLLALSALATLYEKDLRASRNRVGGVFIDRGKTKEDLNKVLSELDISALNKTLKEITQITGYISASEAYEVPAWLSGLKETIEARIAASGAGASASTSMTAAAGAGAL